MSTYRDFVGIFNWEETSGKTQDPQERLYIALECLGALPEELEVVAVKREDCSYLLKLLPHNPTPEEVQCNLKL